MIQLKDVSFSYGDTKILDSVSLAVHQGEYVAIIGANGSGKSTLLKLILGFLKPSSGQISVLGQEIDHFNQFSRLGYVRQGGLLNVAGFKATALETVLLKNPATSFFSFYRKDKEAKALAALKRVHMDHMAHELIGNLSGGQLQRVLIARELMSQPDLLFMDEPTTGLDTASIENLYGLLRQLNLESKITIVLVSHNIDHISHEVNHVYEIKDSGIKEVGGTCFNTNL